MEKLGAAFGTFVFSVLAQWFELLSGCVVLVIIGLLEKYFLKREIPIKVYTMVLAAFVFWACFQAWHEQYEINKNAPVHQMTLANMQAEALRKDEKIRELKDASISSQVELSALHSEKEALIRELSALRDEMKIARSSVLASEIDVVKPYIHEESNRTLLIIPVVNFGQTRTTIISSQAIILIGGNEYSQIKNNVPILLRPKSSPFNFPVPLPTDIFKDDRQERLAVFEYTYKGILDDEHRGCVGIAIHNGKFAKKFEMPGESQDECQKRFKKRKPSH